MNQLNYTVENGGAIYTNPSGIILSASRICRLDGPWGIPAAEVSGSAELLIDQSPRPRLSCRANR